MLYFSLKCAKNVAFFGENRPFAYQFLKKRVFFGQKALDIRPKGLSRARNK
jgi:hypothetical protein